ncbi:S41 family peptidase [Taibaiella chishuiensis]|uniref:Peptidase S41-like protein n=1 Tax=Taibaiella chishuiensis TaxID=1434707 RepID=A0A2P8D0W4_9BACT|nr:S41 family peptidase [Taibaiella chishuiensis]PSK90862.1 peptidase S41-like protein [Taibaiella chishuiensis]
MKYLSATLTFIFILFTGNSYSQVDDVTFLINRIKDNYAGYEDKVKGNEFDNYVKAVLREEKKDTFKILSKIVIYFENPHLQIFHANSLQDIKIDSTSCKQNLEKVRHYFSDNKSKKEGREGFYINDKNSSVLALIKEKGTPISYSAYIMETRNPPSIPYGYLFAKIEQQPNGKFLADFVTPRGAMRVFIPVIFRNDSTFTTSDLAKWHKLNEDYSKPIISSLSPMGYYTFGKLLDKDNYLLTMSDFQKPSIELVDSIIKKDFEIIKSTKNLILDIRDNSGGTVRTYRPLYQFVYTNPIVAIGAYTKYSKDYSEQMKESLERLRNSPKIDSTILKYREDQLRKSKGNIGKFVHEPGDTLVMDSVMAYPKNIAIIMNYAVESAGEMMVLDFKQSKKVKTFGEPTMGAVDYLNTYNTMLPSGKYTLILATTKREIPSGQSHLDKTGIQPDVPLQDSVPDWVEFVKNYYKNGN